MGTEVTNLGLVSVGLGSASPKIAPEPDSFGSLASKPTIVVDDAHLLFTGDFRRAGSDLVISSDDRQIVIDNYFRNEIRAALASPDGAMLTGNLVEQLVGEIQYAQAGATTGAAAVIGKVSKVGGLATVVRNGVSVQLNIGDNVHKGDVVQTATNSALVLVFVDGTVFGLAASARMVLNEMVYDPNGSSNSSLLSLVQGTITFVAGQTAKNGDMKVDTPVATMGIRGTAVLSEMGFTVPPIGGQLPVGPPPLRVQVLEEPGGVTGSFVLYSKINPNNVIGQVSQSGQITSVFANGNISTQPAPPLSLAAQSIIDQTMREYFPNYTPRSIAPNGSSSPWGGATDPFNFDPINFERGSTVEPLQLRAEAPFPKLGGDDPLVFENVNSPPQVSVSNVVVVLTLGTSASSFSITDQVTIFDPDATNQFHDIPVPYVAGSGRIVGTSGLPASLLDFDPQTGRISYDADEFAFLPQEGTATFTIAFDSRSGPDTVHRTLTVTIVGVNDPPIFTSAFFTVRESGSVVLVSSNFGVFDPDSTNFTFTVSNVTHGQMEIFANGVWSPTTTFTSADIAAGHVRFVHDGSNSAPTFSIQASDGFSSSNVFGGTVNFEPTITPTGENDRVFEAGLATGSAAAGNGEFAQGTFIVADPDGLPDVVSVTINGVTIAIGSLAGQVIVGAHGILTVTGYNAQSGVASYTYQLTSATTDAPVGSETDVFTLTASDGTVTSAPAAITIEIVDDVPDAVNDAHTVANATPVSGNVLANDVHPNGQPGADAPIAFLGWATTVGTYGTFVANADGTYSYVLDTTNPAVRALDSGETLTETFGYAIKDADGDVDTAALTITIAGSDEAPTVAVNTGNPTNVNDVVFEAGLANGSNAAGNGELAFGTLTLADADGLDDLVSVTVNNETVAIDNLVGHVFEGAFGTLTITAYNAATGVASYTYRLTTASTDSEGVTEKDQFTLSTSDGTLSSGSVTITVEIADDIPNAVNDAHVIPEDADAPVVGNVLANDVHPNGQPGADAPVQFVGWNGSTTAHFGTFVANEDGSYSYVPDISNPLVRSLDVGETLTETFAYTISDADGDTDTATLTITISGGNDAPSVTVDTGNPLGGNDAVFEAGLPAGSAASGDGEFAFGTLTLLDPDGLADIVSVTVNNQTVAIGSLVDHVFVGAHGILTVTAYDTTTGVASYTYQLTGAATDTSGPETDVFTVTASDGSLSSTPSTITIEIVDDAPNAVNDARSITEDEVKPLEGNVLANDVHSNGQPGADVPTSFVSWYGDTSAKYGTFVANLDGTPGAYGYLLDDSNPLVQGLDTGEVLVETFSYTMQDADGDTDTATLTITITGENDRPTVAVHTGNSANANDHVLEAGLATGSAASSNGEFAGGTFTLADADGLDDIVSVTINNQTVALGSLVNHVFTGAHGTFTVTAYDTTTGVASYAYHLTSATTDVSSALETDVFTLITSDGAVVSAAATITIEIDDDAPNAVNDQHTIAEDTVAPIQGNVLANDVHPNGQTGADAPVSFVGWDGSTSGAYGTFVANADGSYSYALNSANPLVQQLGTSETLVETFAYTIRDADGDLDTATLTITINGANDAPTVTNTQVWLQSDPAQQTAGTPTYPNGYPILIGTPSDIDGDSLTVTVGSVPAGVYYFNGNSYVALTSGTVLFNASSSLDLLHNLVYRPTESISDAVGVNLSLVVSDGTTAVTQTVGIHEVVQNHIPIESFGASVGNDPLTSGNTQTATQIISQSQADAINHNIGALTVVVQTDFQKNPTDTPVPIAEQGIGTEAGAARETEVSVYLNLTHEGTTTRFVIVADDPDNGPLVQSWSFNAATGLMEAQVAADHMFVSDANGDPTSTSLSSWLASNPVSQGDTWNTLYVDDTGGHFQARQFAVEIFPNDPADPGIVVSGDPVLADQIYGTSGNDTLSGNGGDDIIDGRGGNDLVFGGSGADNFKFAFATGNTAIGDFAPQQDHIDVSAFVAASELDAWFASHVGESPANNADTLITLDNNQTVTLKNVPVSNLSSSDFIVQAH